MEGKAGDRPAKKPTRTQKPPKTTTSDHNQEYGAQKRPRKTACVVCRKRKRRCDGNKPICGACARLDNICAYDEVETKTPPSNSRSSKTGTTEQPKIIGAHSSETPKLTTTSSVNLHLQEWIDGNTVYSSVQIAGDVGFAETYFNTCLAALQRIWSFVLHSSDILNQGEKRAVKESLSRLILWMDGFEPGILDRILDRAEDLRENVLQLINDIAKPLAHKLVPLTLKSARDPFAEFEHSKRESSIATTDQFQRDIRNINSLNEKYKSIIFNGVSQDESDVFTSDDDSETTPNPTTSCIFDISSASKRLMELLPSLEKSMTSLQGRKIENGTPPSISFKVSEPASYFISRVIDNFRKADINLAERLGEANWQRYERIRRQNEMIVNGLELPAHRDDIVAHSVFKPFSMFHDSGIGTSKPAESSYAISNASHTSFLTSLTKGGNGSLRVPELPEGATMGKPFQCEICGHVLSKIKNRIDWKIHVFADLQPYICTWTDCKDKLATFPTRRLWGNHEFERHRMKTTWRCYECSADLANPDDLKAHLVNQHQTPFSDSQLEIAASTAKITQSVSVKDMKCPLCLCHAGDTRRAFENHVGKHMEKIALASLPKDAAEDSDVASEKSTLGLSWPPRQNLIKPDQVLRLPQLNEVQKTQFSEKVRQLWQKLTSFQGQESSNEFRNAYAQLTGVSQNLLKGVKQFQAARSQQIAQQQQAQAANVQANANAQAQAQQQHQHLPPLANNYGGQYVNNSWATRENISHYAPSQLHIDDFMPVDEYEQ